jgi:hypothetical protein
VLGYVPQPRSRSFVALAGWVVLVATAVVWGHHLLPGGTLNSHAPPFLGRYRVSLRALVPGALFAAGAVLVLPTVTTRLPWRLLLPFSAVTAAGWAVALAVWDGHASLSAPISRAHEYLAALPAVGHDPARFLGRFADDVTHRRLPVHVNGHPPLMVLVLWGWDRVGAVGPGWAAALVIGAGASSVAAIALVLRDLGDEAAARRALPFLVLGPFAVTVATSADAFYLGVGAWSAVALQAGLRRQSWPLFAVAGLLAGALPYLSYGLLPFGAVLLTVGWLAIRRHGWPGRSATHRTVLAVAFVAGLALVPVLLTANGFWWFDGVAATHRAWQLGRGDDRPYAYSFLADFAILAVLVGPATIVAATRRPGRVPMALASASLIALVALAAAGITRLEVERIWLPFAPWIVVLTSALPARSRGWLLANAACAVAFQLLVYDVW